MKKVTYLVVLMLSMVTMFTACEKDDGDDPIVPKTITVDDLKGYWNFEKLVIEGTTYNWDADAIALDAHYNGGALDLRFGKFDEFSSSNTIRYYDKFASDNNGYAYSFDVNALTTNIINADNGELVFEIENASTFLTTDTKSVLKLKLISSKLYGNAAPINGIYTLTK
jgi:hypothetical protein